MKSSPSKSYSINQVEALVIRTAGINCDQETVHALTLSGARCDIVHIHQLLTGHTRLYPYHILVFPGGFSYGDDISAGESSRQ